MFLVRAFKAHQGEPVPIRLVSIDMTPEQDIAELYLDGGSHIVLLTLQQENSDFPELNYKVLGMELFIVLLKPQS